MKIEEITIRELGVDPCSVFIFGKKRPGIFKESEGGYGIRIKIGENRKGDNLSESYDYFKLDDTGLIIQSPRGYAKKFNKKVRIMDIEDALEKYK